MSRKASGALLASCVHRPRHQLESAFGSTPSIETRKGPPPPAAGAKAGAPPPAGAARRGGSARPLPGSSGRPVESTSGRPVPRVGGRRAALEGAERAATGRAAGAGSWYSRRDGRSPIGDPPPPVL